MTKLTFLVMSDVEVIHNKTLQKHSDAINISLSKK